jgi:membrane protein implicated in regulation of membrane protease activity
MPVPSAVAAWQPALLVGGVVAVAVVAALVARRHAPARHTRAVREISQLIGACHGAIDRLHAAHDHHVEGVDRRLEAVEAAAAAATQEVRIISVQLTEVAATLDRVAPGTGSPVLGHGGPSGG